MPASPAPPGPDSVPPEPSGAFSDLHRHLLRDFLGVRDYFADRMAVLRDPLAVATGTTRVRSGPLAFALKSMFALSLVVGAVSWGIRSFGDLPATPAQRENARVLAVLDSLDQYARTNAEALQRAHRRRDARPALSGDARTDDPIARLELDSASVAQAIGSFNYLHPAATERERKAVLDSLFRRDFDIAVALDRARRKHRPRSTPSGAAAAYDSLARLQLDSASLAYAVARVDPAGTRRSIRALEKAGTILDSLRLLMISLGLTCSALVFGGLIGRHLPPHLSRRSGDRLFLYFIPATLFWPWAFLNLGGYAVELAARFGRWETTDQMLAIRGMAIIATVWTLVLIRRASGQLARAFSDDAGPDRKRWKRLRNAIENRLVLANAVGALVFNLLASVVVALYLAT